MHNQRVCVIYNPAAGQGTARGRIPRVEALLTEHEISFDMRVTERPGHAIELATEAAGSSYSAVVAAGGDGTANEVINGLMRAKNADIDIPPLAVISVGRGNDFAYAAGIPSDMKAAVAALHDGVTRPIDVGFLKGGDYPDGRFFGNGIGVGFDTIVGFEAAKMKRIKGFAAYVIGALRTIFLFYRAPTVRYRYAGIDKTEPLIQISIMNGRRMGGAFHMAPDADIRDGMLDLCIGGSPTRREMIGLMVRYVKGTQATSRHIRMGRTEAITIESPDGELAVHADGETICEAAKRLDVECVPAALQTIVPAHAVE